MKAKQKGVKPAAKASRKGWTQMPSGAVSYGWITPRETEISPAIAKGLIRNMAVMDPYTHEVAQEVMSLAT